MGQLIGEIYRRFHPEHDLPLPEPAMFSVAPHQAHLDLLRREAELFRNGARTVITEKHFLVQRCLRTAVHRAQDLLRGTSRGTRMARPRSTPSPSRPRSIAAPCRNRSSTSDMPARHAGRSRKTTQRRILRTQREARRMQARLTSLHNVRQAVGNAAIPDAQGKIRPQLVAGLGSKTA